MYTRAYFISIAALALFASSIGYKAFVVHDADRTAYGEMVAQTREENHPEKPLTQQLKRGVKKEVYQGNTHSVITADHSRIDAIPLQERYELIEHLFSVSGVVEDEDVRRFKARDGTYYYSTHEFISPMVAIQMIKDGEMYKGLAKDLVISLKDASLRSSQMQMETKELSWPY